ESLYYTSLRALYALITTNTLNPTRNWLTLAALHDAVSSAFEASSYLTAHPTYQQIHTNIHLEGSDTLLVTLWCARLSHVLGFPAINPLAAALKQTFQESVRTYRKLRQPEPYAVPKGTVAQRRSMTVQPCTQRKCDSSECSHCRKATSSTKLQLTEWFSLECQKEVDSGARSIVGKVSSTPVNKRPWVISPSGIEPSKPRKFDNATFLNQWCDPPKFSLPKVTSFQQWHAIVAAITDLKSAFFNIPLHPDSRTFLGSRAVLQDGIEYYLSMIYIDDCVVSPPVGATPAQSNSHLVAILLLFQLGGFVISLPKSDFRYRSSFRYLGISVHLLDRTFAIPGDKLVKFNSLVSSVLVDHLASVRTIQRIAGKCAHFVVAIVGALAFTWEM
ncbi:hypothetical protein HDU77_000508, partial [Chytriomyces hyalinus]